MSVSASELESAVIAAIKKQAEAVIGSNDFSGFRKTTVDTRHIEDCENRTKLLSEQRQDCYERFFAR